MTMQEILNNLEKQKRGLNRNLSNDRKIQSDINNKKAMLIVSETYKAKEYMETYLLKELKSLYDRIDILNSEVKEYRKDLIDNGIIKKSNINLF